MTVAAAAGVAGAAAGAETACRLPPRDPKARSELASPASRVQGPAPAKPSSSALSCRPARVAKGWRCMLPVGNAEQLWSCAMLRYLKSIASSHASNAEQLSSKAVGAADCERAELLKWR